jgi:hypothetical protein
LGRFEAWDVLRLGHFEAGTFCSLDLMSLEVLYLGRFAAWTLCLWTFCRCTVQAHAAFPFIPMLHVHPCPPCLSMYVNAVCSCCIQCRSSMLHVHVSCPCCISILYVHAACQCLIPFFISMLHVHATSPCCISMLHAPAVCLLHALAAYLLWMPMLHVH